MTRPWILIAICIFIVATTSNVAQGQRVRDSATAVASESATSPSTKMMVYVPRSTPVAELAKILVQIYDEDSGLRVVASPTNNTLLISAPMAQLERLAKLLPELDRKQELIEIEVVIVRLPLGKDGKRRADPQGDPESFKKMIADAEKSGDLMSIDRVRVCSLENQPAFVQVGQRKPTTRGTTSRSGGFGSSRPSSGFRTTTVSYENVGMIVKVTPVVRGDDTIVMNVDIEKSELDESGTTISGGSEDAAPIKIPQISTSTAQSTLAVKNGKTIVIGGVNSTGGNGGHQLIMLLTGKVK